VSAPWLRKTDPNNPETSLLLQAVDWEKTPLGPLADWPVELKTLAGLMVRSKSPQHIVWGPEQILLYNDGYIPILGDRHPKAFGMRFADVWPDIWEGVEPIVRRTYAGTADYFENHPWLLDRGDHKDQVWITFAYTPVEDDGGTVLGFHCTFHETTAAVLAQQELGRATEEVFGLAQERQLALDAAHLGWWQYDPASGLVRHDARYAEIYGLTGDSPHHVDDVSAVLHPDDVQHLWEAVAAATLPADPTPYRVEYRIVRSDGSTRWLEARGIASFEGVGDARKVSNFVGTVADITERRLAEDVLRENEARFRLMADTAPAVLWLTDPTGSCTFLSREWYALSGQTEEEALGLGWTTATHPGDQERSGNIFLEANAARKPFQIEYRLRTADGSYRWAIDMGRPWFTENGDYAGMVGVVLDIDDRKRAEQALEDQSRRKDEFLAMLAHELRNPLAPIGTAAQILKRTGGDPVRTAQSAAVIERQVGHLTTLVDDLLDVSRVTRGLVSIAREPVDIRSIVAAALE
jgi:PAS domain S-box-containing protein